MLGILSLVSWAPYPVWHRLFFLRPPRASFSFILLFSLLLFILLSALHLLLRSNFATLLSPFRVSDLSRDTSDHGSLAHSVWDINRKRKRSSPRLTSHFGSTPGRKGSRSPLPQLGKPVALGERESLKEENVTCFLYHYLPSIIPLPGEGRGGSARISPPQ